MYLFWSLLLIVLGNQLLFLVPASIEQDQFKPSDFALLLTFVLDIIYGFRAKNVRILINKISVLIVILTIGILIQVGLANMYYNQTILDGMIGDDGTRCVGG